MICYFALIMIEPPFALLVTIPIIIIIIILMTMFIVLSS